MDFDNLLKSYNFHLPKELIAQSPARPRQAARLLIYRKKNQSIKFDTFQNIGKYLPKNAVMVFNQTRVIPARLTVVKPGGGRARILYLSHNKNFIQALSDRPLLIGQHLLFYRGRVKMTGKILKKIGSIYHLKITGNQGRILKILNKYGQTPLPPYIKHSPLTERQRRREYQTVFAKDGASVAAPTASLHFTKKLTAGLKKQGVAVRYISLDVGLGTFAPLKEENLLNKKLHLETYHLRKTTADFLLKAKKENRPIITVGTTVVRTLESAFKNVNKPILNGSTDLFITAGYRFNTVNGLITNFHVPKSSLMMLVSALVGRKALLKLYKKAIHSRMRFFSFGDGMLILP